MELNEYAIILQAENYGLKERITKIETLLKEIEIDLNSNMIETARRRLKVFRGEIERPN